MTTRADVVAEARTQLGVRWMHQAALRDVAMDCVGLATVVAAGLNLPAAAEWRRDPALQGYGRAPDALALVTGCRKYLDPISIASAGLGDVLVFKFETDPQHFAVISAVDPMRIIHAYAAARKVVENGITGEWRAGITWQSLIVSAWRFRGVD